MDQEQNIGKEGARLLEENKQLNKEAVQMRIRVSQLEFFLSEFRSKSLAYDNERLSLDSMTGSKGDPEKQIQVILENTKRIALKRYQRAFFIRFLRSLWAYLFDYKSFKKLCQEKRALLETGLFEHEYYLVNNLELLDRNIDLLEHFLIEGCKEFRNPNSFFDLGFYNSRYPDVMESGINPVVHYYNYGAAENRNPHPSFDTQFYLEQNQDVLTSGHNPLVHYIKYGRAEGRKCKAEPKVPKCLQEFNRKKENTHIEPFYGPSEKKDDLLNTNLSIVVVFHLFHGDILDECLGAINNIPFPFHLLVTTSLPVSSPIISRVREVFRDVEVVHLPNAGRDIGPFVKCWSRIKEFDLCCKIHTKKGGSDYIRIWRELSIKGVLGSPGIVEGIVKQFEINSHIAAAGHELLYGSYKRMISVNQPKVEAIVKECGIKNTPTEDYGFFMGSMFWLRTGSYEFISHLKDIIFPVESGAIDGGYEHALERMLGSFAIAPSEKILLVNALEGNVFSSKIIDRSYEPEVKTFHKYFDVLLLADTNKDYINGYIDAGKEVDASIHGWLGLKGDNKPREAVIFIDNKLVAEISCDLFRKDLNKSGINEGQHAFKLDVPFEYVDGRRHKAVLVDKYSGRIVDQIDFTKTRLSDVKILRHLGAWNKDLEEAFFQRLAKINKNVEKNDTFVSVIMPTFNRAGQIETAINSVLSQSYSNLELLIVDDGSDDNTGEEIANYLEDSRVKYFRRKRGGVSKARNYGLDQAMGEYIFFLDSDNIWAGNYVETMLAYMKVFSLDSAYAGLVAFDNSTEAKFYLGDLFSWRDCAYHNYIDLNCFGHRRLLGEHPIRFDESLKRLVDWEYILHFLKDHTTSYAPFLGVHYYDGENDRITNTEYRSEEEFLRVVDTVRSRYFDLERNIDDQALFYSRLLGSDLHPSFDRNAAAKVDTIITTYNHEQYIAQAIESVLIQKGHIDHRVIISDDGSQDRTREVIAKYKRIFPDKIVDLSSEENVGISLNMKRCIDFSNADYLAICEGDDYWTEPYKLAKQIDFMDKNQSCSMVFSQIEVNNTEQNTTRVLGRQQSLSKNILSAQDFLNHASMNLIGNFSCCLFKAQVLKELPSFVYEDRINEIAVTFHFDKYGDIGFLKEVLSVYRQHPDGLWSGSDRLAQLKSGLIARKMVLKIADEKYAGQISKVIEEKYLAPLTELEQQ